MRGNNERKCVYIQIQFFYIGFVNIALPTFFTLVAFVSSHKIKEVNGGRTAREIEISTGIKGENKNKKKKIKKKSSWERND